MKLKFKNQDFQEVAMAAVCRKLAFPTARW